MGNRRAVSSSAYTSMARRRTLRALRRSGSLTGAARLVRTSAAAAWMSWESSVRDRGCNGAETAGSISMVETSTLSRPSPCGRCATDSTLGHPVMRRTDHRGCSSVEFAPTGGPARCRTAYPQPDHRPGLLTDVAKSQPLSVQSAPTLTATLSPGLPLERRGRRSHRTRI